MNHTKVDLDRMIHNLFDYFQKHNTNFKVKFKNESNLMKVLGFLLFFNKNFMETTTTTIGNTIYFPSQHYYNSDKRRTIRVLSHEWIHILDYNTDKLFVFKYLFPQILSIFALLSFINLWFLLFLIFLLPLPAPFRVKYEMRGYRANTHASLLTNENLNGFTSDEYHNLRTPSFWYIFTGWKYYKMYGGLLNYKKFNNGSEYSKKYRKWLNMMNINVDEDDSKDMYYFIKQCALKSLM